MTATMFARPAALSFSFGLTVFFGSALASFFCSPPLTLCVGDCLPPRRAHLTAWAWVFLRWWLHSAGANGPQFGNLHVNPALLRFKSLYGSTDDLICKS